MKPTASKASTSATDASGIDASSDVLVVRVARLKARVIKDFNQGELV